MLLRVDNATKYAIANIIQTSLKKHEGITNTNHVINIPANNETDKDDSLEYFF